MSPGRTPGPLDVIGQGVTGVLHADLAVAIGCALRLDRGECARRAALAAGRNSAMIARMAAHRQAE